MKAHRRVWIFLISFALVIVQSAIKAEEVDKEVIFKKMAEKLSTISVK